MTGGSFHISPPRPRINLAKNTVEFRDAPSGATLIPPTEILPQESSGSGSSTSNRPQGKSLEANIPSFPLPASSRDDAQTEVVTPLPVPTATTPGPAQQPFSEQSAADDGLAKPFGSCAPDSHTLSRLPTPPSVPAPPSNHTIISPTYSVEGSCPPSDSDSHVREPSQQHSTLVDAISMCEAHLLAARNDLSMEICPEDALCAQLPQALAPSTMETRDLYRGSESHPREEPRTPQLSHPSPLRDLPSSNNLDHIMDADENVLAITPQHSILFSQFQAQANHFFETVQGLTSALNAVHRSHTEVENTLTQQHRCLTEQRSALRAVEADYQAQLQHLNHSREALHQRETALAASERECRSREEARNAQWQAREEKRCAALKSWARKHQVQVDTCLKELEELKKAREAEQQRYAQPIFLPPVPTHPNLPTEAQEGMNEEEVKTIKERKALIDVVHHIRRMYAQKVDSLEQSTNALARLQEEREKRVAEEAQQKLLAEEEERARQAAAEEQRERAAAQAVREKSSVEAAERHCMPAASGNDCMTPQYSAEKPAHIETQATISNTDPELAQRRQEEYSRKRAEVMAQKQQANAENAARIRAAREGLTTAPSEGNNAATAADEAREAFAVSPPSIVQRPVATQRHSPSSPKSRKKAVVASGGVMLSTPQGGSSFGPTAARPPTTPGHGKSSIISAKTPSFVSASTEAGRQVATDTPLFPIQLASELNNASSANADVYHAVTPPRQTFALNPKSQTLLEAGGRELDLGPTSRVSPAQHTVNLRHLKKSRSYVEVRGGDRSVIKGSVKVEDSTTSSLKKEEDQELPTLFVQKESRPHSDQQEMNMSQIPPPRLAVIPPPRPNKPAPTRVPSAPDVRSPVGGAQNNVQALAPPSQPPRASPNPWVMDASAERQEWAPQPTPSPSPPEVVHPNSQETSSKGHANVGGAAPAEAQENRPLTAGHSHPRPSPESLTTSLYETDRSRERWQYERTRTYTREVDHYSPSKSPPPSSYIRRSSQHLGDDRWKARMSSIAIPTRPIVGKKRRSESVDDDYSYRSRRARMDERVPDTYEVEPWNDRYRPRSPLPDYHGSGTNPWVQADSYVPRRDPPARTVDDPDPTDRYYRRPASTFSPPPHFPTREQEIRQDTEDQVEGQQDPPLLARMSDRQHFPLPAPPRVRGKTEWGKGRDTGVLGEDDTGRGRGERGRSNISKPARNGVRLIERLREEPMSLEERLM